MIRIVTLGASSTFVFHDRDNETYPYYLEQILNNVSKIYEEYKKRGILFIAATQQAQSNLFNRKKIKGITYERESDLVRKKILELGHINADELYFLAHNVLMKDLKAWAATQNVPLVDVIEVTNQDRDVLVSWVYLNAKGNQMVAREFSEEILKYTCPDSIYQKTKELAKNSIKFPEHSL